MSRGQGRVVVSETGGPGVVRFVEGTEIPEPGDGEARVRVLASGVAFADVLMRRGRYPGGPEAPYTPGYDLVGEVDAVGDKVSGVGVGQRVAALTVTGANARYTLVPAGELVPVPEGVDPAEAVCLPLNYVTAYQILFRVAGVRPGETVLVHGAAGGVGTAVLELSRLWGLGVYGTASGAKHDLVASYGATPIDYKGEDFVERVRALAGGVDVVLDPLGGRHLSRSYRALDSGGRLVAYGVSSAVAGSVSSGRFVLAETLARLAAHSVVPDGKKVGGFYVISRYKRRHPAPFKKDLTALLGLLAEGRISPLVAGRLPLEQASRAHEMLEQASTRGKLVLVPDGEGHTR